jgi:hypothetical protein
MNALLWFRAFDSFDDLGFFEAAVTDENRLTIVPSLSHSNFLLLESNLMQLLVVAILGRYIKHTGTNNKENGYLAYENEGVMGDLLSSLRRALEKAEETPNMPE